VKLSTRCDTGCLPGVTVLGQTVYETHYRSPFYILFCILFLL
jgi:hypothetical protein